MRVLFITERFPPEIGGVAASAERTARGMFELGHEVHVFSLTRELPGLSADSIQHESGPTIHRLGRSKNVDFTLQQALNFLEWLHRTHPFTLVWGHYVQTAGFLATWFARRHSLPAVLSVRGNDLDRQLFPPGDLARLQWCLQNCEQVVAVSQDLADKVQCLVGRTARVLPNAVDTDIFRPGSRPPELAERYGIDSTEVVLGFSGELRAKKGLTFLVAALQNTLARRPARLLIIGEVRAKDQSELVRVTSGHPEVPQAITCTGHLPDPRDVVRHLHLCDVFVLPSIWEGMPNSMLEAMAAGIPVIASDAGAIGEVISDGKNGLLIPKTHLHLLADRIDELLSMTGARRRSLTDAARDTVDRRHTLAAESERLAEILGDLSSKLS